MGCPQIGSSLTFKDRFIIIQTYIVVVKMDRDDRFILLHYSATADWYHTVIRPRCLKETLNRVADCQSAPAVFIRWVFLGKFILIACLYSSILFLSNLCPKYYVIIPFISLMFSLFFFILWLVFVCKSRFLSSLFLRSFIPFFLPLFVLIL